MPSTVTNLAEWKKSNTPAIRMIEAHNRAVVAWWYAWFRLWLR